jgi:aryl-alcohol dehydrogenase-like predicted oxidoreductase
VVVDAALDAGITLFDTADVYSDGQSEELLGQALVGRRESAIVATKFGHQQVDLGYGSAARAKGSGRYIRQAVNASLRRLQTDYIDLYQLHMPDLLTPTEVTLTALDELVREGKVQYVGSSNLSGWQIAEAACLASERGITAFVSAQNEWSLLNRSAEIEVLPAARHFGVSVLPFFPLANGLLSGKVRRGQTFPTGSRLSERTEPIDDEVLDRLESPAHWAGSHRRSMPEMAVAALAAQPGCGSVIAGATTSDQVKQNAGAAAWLPTALEVTELHTLVPRPVQPMLTR